MKAQVIKADGAEQDVQPENGEHFTLKEMQSAVGGFIEMIQLSDGRLMILNEEGKLRNLSVNRKATEASQGAGLMAGDVIVGDVLIVPASMVE